VPPRLRGFIAFLVLSSVFSAISAAQNQSLRTRLILAEDRRAQSESELASLRQALTHNDAKIRQQAVRGIGRLERADLIATLTRSLTDSDVNVRMEAANAVGQSARGAAGVAAAKARLIARARVEQDPRVWGVVAATLGRLPYTMAADVDQVETVIARVLPTATSTSIQVDALLGAAEGLEALARQSSKISKLKGTTLNGLRAAAGLEGRPEDAEKLARIRRLATLALTAAGGVTRPRLEGGIADSDEEVRRLTIVAARADIDGREAVVRKGLADASPRVRYEALQTWGRVFQTASCDPVVAALADNNPHVALLAIDLLGNGCPGGDPAARLREIAAGSLDRPRGWHRPAHAIVSLAKVSAGDAATALPRFATHSVWQSRMYAAHAAAALKDVATLVTLARDQHPNVREAALGELIALKRAEAIPAALDAVTANDYQLVITAARALAAAPDPSATLPVLQKAFDRISAERRDTARDALNAIRDAVSKLGGSALPEPKAEPIAARALTDKDFDTLRGTRLRFTMTGLGSFELRLLPDEAAVTAIHVASLARQGYYNGLTFHRVVPNFVIQGGSPGANEYVGQGPFMRDEVGLLSHRRSTVGISTRGRDTGDAQIFINLVDLPRLDHIYTVFAEVVSGMDIVDAILEGDVIERVEAIAAGS
jgi:cyclophilin family peptidyl-prolyl cis-trans isomerase/HEAT repeat protein